MRRTEVGNVKAVSVYLLCAITFTVILSYSLDRHFDEMVHERIYFQGWGPFTMARVLSPLCIRAVNQVVPSERTSAFIYITICLTALFYAFSKHVHLLTGIDHARSHFFSLILFLPLIWNYVILSSALYPGDIAAILFFTLGMNALLEKQDISFHIILLLALMNRESSVFLIPAMFLINIRKRRLPPLVIHCLVLIIAAAVVRVLLMHFVSTSGANQPNLFDQFFIANIRFLGSIFSGNLEALRMLMTFAGFWILIPFGFKHLNSIQKRLLILFPIFLIGMVVVGNLNNEARIFNEMVPIITVPALVTLSKRIS